VCNFGVDANKALLLSFDGSISSGTPGEQSYQRARESRIVASAGRVFVRVRHATSSGPPVQRIGTHCSGEGVAAAANEHDSNKRTKMRLDMTVDCRKAVIALSPILDIPSLRELFGRISDQSHQCRNNRRSCRNSENSYFVLAGGEFFSFPVWWRRCYPFTVPN